MPVAVSRCRLVEPGRTRRKFRETGVNDLAGYRAATPGQTTPRILLVVDEFQAFFTEDDKLAQEASLLLDRLVRQGRAFGMHVLLGSQTLGGSSEFRWHAAPLTRWRCGSRSSARTPMPS